METGQGLTLDAISEALQDLNQVSIREYGVGLESLLLDSSPNSTLRVQRLVGIILKQPFAIQSPAVPYSLTGAQRSWPWASHSPEQYADVAPKELAILDQLRLPGSWNERKPLMGNADDVVPITWSQLKDDADNERGLFKILALYVDDKLKQREGKSLKEYLEADESPRFEAGLDLATLVFDASVTTPIATLLGVPTIAVGVVLVGIQYGYRKATDTTRERVGDQSS